MRSDSLSGTDQLMGIPRITDFGMVPGQGDQARSRMQARPRARGGAHREKAVLLRQCVFSEIPFGVAAEVGEVDSSKEQLGPRCRVGILGGKKSDGHVQVGPGKRKDWQRITGSPHIVQVIRECVDRIFDGEGPMASTANRRWCYGYSGQRPVNEGS